MKIRYSLLIILALMVPACSPVFNRTKYGTVLRDVTYCTMNDQPQKLDIYFPSAGGPWPVLMYIHGGSWYQGDKSEGEGWRGMNENGFLVVSVNYRLGNNQTKFPAMIEDVKCAVRYLCAHSAEYNIDSEHIAALGVSAGGHLAALLGAADETAGWDVGEYLKQSSKVQAVVDISGIADFTSNIPSSLNTSIFYTFGNLANKNTPENIAASPITYVTPDDPPFLIIHGDRDDIVPVIQATTLHDKLTEAGIPSKLVIVKGGDHGLQPPSNGETNPTGDQIIQIIIEFLETNFK